MTRVRVRDKSDLEPLRVRLQLGSIPTAVSGNEPALLLSSGRNADRTRESGRNRFTRLHVSVVRTFAGYATRCMFNSALHANLLALLIFVF